MPVAASQRLSAVIASRIAGLDYMYTDSSMSLYAKVSYHHTGNKITTVT